jgi:T5SS/PEP-CTERM-associated repeat protein/autotransporter-associated beta strand protein
MKKTHLFAALLCLGEITSHFVLAQELIVDGGTTNITGGINFYGYTLVGGATSDNQLNVLNGGTLLTNSGSLTVGQSGSSNSLVISNEGMVANTSGAIGANSSSSNNSVLVTGTNSTWTNSGTLYVGYAGSSNSLVISNGATVANTVGSIGDRFTSSENSVLVTGTGSRWTTSENLYVGYSGSSNSLVISNGATVASATGFVGLDSTSSNNSVLVTGSNSLWTNLGDLRMVNGASNRLVISSGGKVVSSNGYVGLNNTDVEPSVDSNQVLVTDVGSSWRNSAQLFVGAGPFSGGNSLVISNGGVVYGGVTVENGEGVIVGSYASNNSVMVDGSESRLFVTGGLMVGKGGNGWANENSLTVSGGGQVISLDNIGMTIGFAQSSNNSVLVTGTGSLLSFNDLAVGGNYEGSGTLTVSDGASIVATNFIDISYQSPGTLNVGALNGSDTAGTITASHIRVGFLSTNGSLNFNQTDTLTLTSRLSGIGTINQFGSGTTILTGSNSRFTGVTTITNGQLQFGDGVTAGGAPVAGNMSNNASLVFAPASTDTYRVRGNISGSGRLTEIGTGTTVLSGNNSDFTGLTRIKQGTLQFGDGVTAGGAPVAGSISNNASLIFAPSSSDTYTVSGNISGSGRFTQIGNGTTVLSGNNTYTGGTVIANGLLATTSTNALGTGFVTVTNTGKLAPGVDDALVIAGDFTFTTGSAFVWQLLGNTNGGAGNFTPAVDLSANNLSVDLGSTFELFFGPSVDASDAFWAPGATNSWTIFTGTSPSLGAGTNFSLDWAAGSVTDGFDLANFSLGTNATGLVLNYAAPRYLWNTNAGDWTNAANWIDNTVPGAANDAYIDNGGLALVNGDAAAAKNLYVGSTNSGNNLVISNGGQVENFFGYIGFETNSSNNSVLVTGRNSAWNNSSDLYVGLNGSSNSLVISNGGTVMNRTGVIGTGASSNNIVTVTGTGSAWTHAFDLSVGSAGSSNSLVISNGGSVVNQDGYVGRLVSSNNSVLVTGTNSAWTNTGDLVVGRLGNNNSLVISNGGSVVNSDGSIGDRSIESSHNSVLVTGTNSAWTSTGELNVGYYGSSNSLVISNGGAVVNSDGYIGGYIESEARSSNNSVLVTGTSSAWTNTGSLIVGFYGSSNSLVISNGSSVESRHGTIGFDSSSSNNSVLVTGTISAWTNTSELTVGYQGSSNSLVISNGGSVVSLNGRIGTQSSSNNVLVTGTGSAWTNTTELLIGNTGSDNSLVISNGGAVVTGMCLIGDQSTASNNSVLVTGTISAWTNTGDLFVGYYGSSNSLVISNGGTVANRDGFIGFYADSSNNSVLVTGTGSTWTNSGTLVVGVEGTGNTLTVAEGGTIAAANIVIAASNGSSGTLNVGRFGANGAASTISAPTIAFGAGTGVINFNQSNTVTVSSVISGAGMVNQLGTGWTVLSGANTYTGPTTVSAGTLVAQSRTALGTGGVTLLGGTLELQSQLDIGSLLWDGAAVIAMPGAGNGRFLNVTGLLKLTNGVNNFNLAGAALPRSPVKLLSSTNLPSLSTDDFGVLGLGSYTLSIDGNTLYLTAQDISYQSFAISPNQVSVAKALDTFIGAPGDRGTVSAALDTLAISQYPAAFEQLMPSQYASLPSMVFNVANALNSSLFQRMWAVRSSGRGFSSSGMNLAPMQGEMGGTDDMGVFAINPSKETRWGTFVDGNGVFANASSTGSVQNYRSQSGGVSTGAAYSWNEALATGVYVGYQGLQAEYDSGRTIDNAVRFGVFGTYEVEDFYFNALVGGAYHGYTVSRNIDFGGLDRTATGRPGAGEFNLALGTGYDFQAGDLTFGPFTTLQYTYLGVQGFTETGADALDLDVSPYDSSSMLYTLGAQAAYNWKLSKDVIITPVAFAGWQHEFLQNGYTINSSFATGGPAAPFNYNTSSPARDNFYGGAGVTVSLGERWQATFIYSASAANEDNSSQNLYLSAGYKF